MKKNPRDLKKEDLYFPDTAVASSSECTGLEAVPPESRPETEGLREIYDLPLTKQAPQKEPGRRRPKRRPTGR